MEEEERLRRLQEEEDRRRQSAARAQYATGGPIYPLNTLPKHFLKYIFTTHSRTLSFSKLSETLPNTLSHPHSHIIQSHPLPTHSLVLFADAAETYVRELFDNGIKRLVDMAGREADERRLMALEDDASRRRRADDNRLNEERLRLLSEKRGRDEEARLRLLATMEGELQEDIEREVVEEELRKMLQQVLEELEALRRAEEDEQRRLSLASWTRALAEKTAKDVIEAALLNMTGGLTHPQIYALHAFLILHTLLN